MLSACCFMIQMLCLRVVGFRLDGAISRDLSRSSWLVPSYVCIGFLCGCAHRYSSRKIACSLSFGGRACRYSARRIACSRFFGGCARRCLSHLIVYTRFYTGLCSQMPSIACTASRCGDSGTCLTYQCPLLLHAAGFLSRSFLHRHLKGHYLFITTSSCVCLLWVMLLPPLGHAFALARTVAAACAWSLSFSSFQSSGFASRLTSLIAPLLSCCLIPPSITGHTSRK